MNFYKDLKKKSNNFFLSKTVLDILYHKKYPVYLSLYIQLN